MNTFHDRPFYTFLREERQFSFLLAFFLMQKGDALPRFLELIRQGGGTAIPTLPSAALEDAEVYIEYAYLRDRWDSLKRPGTSVPTDVVFTRAEANQAKREFIDRLLRRIPSLIPVADRVPSGSESEFNSYFMGDAGKAIIRDIASPALWPVNALVELSQPYAKEVFSDLCKLKWSFRIKPDLVIEIPGCPPICVEAKLESAEGTYPTGQEAKLFNEKELERVRQFDLQEFMFGDLMDRPCQQVIVQKNPGKNAGGVPVLTWAHVFGSFEAGGALDSAIPFVRRLISENATLKQHSSTVQPPVPANTAEIMETGNP